MASAFDFISPADKPALLALSSAAIASAVADSLKALDYKVHAAGNHNEFVTRFSQFQYQLVVIDAAFGAPEAQTLPYLQRLPMSQRRHATVLLIGEQFESLNMMQAFHQSVHAVVHPKDLGSLTDIARQVVAENDLFLNIYRDTQLRMAQGKG